MLTTEYAALTHGSTPDNSRYVLRDGRIIGAVLQVRDGSGQWRAFMAHDLLDLRNGVTCKDYDDAVATVVADGDPTDREPLYPELEAMAHSVERVLVHYPPEDRAIAIVAGARAMRDYHAQD